MLQPALCFTLLTWGAADQPHGKNDSGVLRTMQGVELRLGMPPVAFEPFVRWDGKTAAAGFVPAFVKALGGALGFNYTYVPWLRLNEAFSGARSFQNLTTVNIVEDQIYDMTFYSPTELEDIDNLTVRTSPIYMMDWSVVVQKQWTAAGA